MTEQKQDRPATLERRKPQPARDESVDPVDLAPAPKAPAKRRKPPAAKLEAPTPKQREAVFPLSTRVSCTVMDALEKVTSTGVTQRAAIEHAIMQTYGRDSMKA